MLGRVRIIKKTIGITKENSVVFTQNLATLREKRLERAGA